jgi:hypothetical protein
MFHFFARFGGQGAIVHVEVNRSRVSAEDDFELLQLCVRCLRYLVRT